MPISIDKPACNWSVLPPKDKRKRSMWRCMSCDQRGHRKTQPRCGRKLIWIEDPADGVFRQATYDPQK